MRLTCGSECECYIRLDNRLMECWQYVSGIPWHKLFNLIRVFEGHIGMIVDVEHEFY